MTQPFELKKIFSVAEDKQRTYLQIILGQTLSRAEIGWVYPFHECIQQCCQVAVATAK
jgi:hypothetical protein